MGSPNAKKRTMDLLKGAYAANGYYGLPDLATSSDLIAQIYTAPTYDDTERAELLSWYGGRSIPVLGEYPRTVQDLPCVFVFRTNDTEDPQGWIGDEMGCDEDLSTNELEYKLRGTLLQERLQISIWATGGPKQRDDLYLAVRQLVLMGRQYFDDADILGLEWSDGKDGQLYDERAKPHIIHKAEATLRYRVPISWTETRETILRVDAIHEDYGGSVVTGSVEFDF